MQNSNKFKHFVKVLGITNTDNESIKRLPFVTIFFFGQWYMIRYMIWTLANSDPIYETSLANSDLDLAGSELTSGRGPN